MASALTTMDRIRIHTNGTDTVQKVHEFTLDDLLEGAKRDRLKAAFIDAETTKRAKREDDSAGKQWCLL